MADDWDDVCEEDPLSRAIDELADMQREFYDRHDEGDFDDWSQRLGVVIDDLEMLRNEETDRT